MNTLGIQPPFFIIGVRVLSREIQVKDSSVSTEARSQAAAELEAV